MAAIACRANVFDDVEKLILHLSNLLIFLKTTLAELIFGPSWRRERLEIINNYFQCCFYYRQLQ